MSQQLQEPLTEEDVEAAVRDLAALGSTASEVAAALIAKGLKARRGCASSCIIAEWLVTEGGLHIDDEIEVDGKVGESGWHVRVWRDGPPHNVYGGGGGNVDLPAHLGDLARRFDRGDWPELVANR